MPMLAKRKEFRRRRDTIRAVRMNQDSSTRETGTSGKDTYTIE